MDFSDLKCPLITIYEKPLDFPNAFVARVWDGAGPRATNTIIMRFSLEECREDIQAAGGHMVIADFEPPKGERQMRADQAQTLMAAAQIISRFQMLTEKETDQILEICENAAVRCGFFKGVTEEEGDKCGKSEN